MVKYFAKKKLVNARPNARPNAAKMTLYIRFSLIQNAEENAEENAGIKFTFEDVWKAYGRRGSKKIAKGRYDKLSMKKKIELAKSIPYYLAFCKPGYYVYLEKYIANEYWNKVEDYEGVAIPKENYHVADADKFVDWFNGKVQDSGIPQISGLTPERYRMLNICYTLCYEEMKFVMEILLSNEKYIDMAKKGMIDFDYIFKPVNLRKIYEYGATKQTAGATRREEHGIGTSLQ